MQNTTLLFLVKKDPSSGRVSEVCLAMKKRGFGVGRWNGTGGKLLEGESIEQAVIRETGEEIGVAPRVMEKAALLSFSFPEKPEWNQLTHVFVCTEWEGEPSESEEMRPEWFAAEQLPFESMWPDDPLWLPLVLDGKMVKGTFSFSNDGAVLEHEVGEAANLQ